jgi:hypothetical protein
MKKHDDARTEESKQFYELPTSKKIKTIDELVNPLRFIT